MTLITSLLSDGWAWVAGIAGVIIALIASYFGGKKIGTTQTQAKADVQTAKVESQQVAAVAKQQSENTETAKNVQASNASLSDDDARSKLQQSRYHSDD